MLLSVVVGAVYATVTQIVNRYSLLRAFPTSPIARQLALVLGCCIALAGVFGSLEFAIKKPFM